MGFPRASTKTKESFLTGVRCFISNPLTSFLLFALLVMIVVVLILPSADLPDTAFQRNSSLQVIRGFTHPLPQPSANAVPSHVRLPFQDTSISFRKVHEASAWLFEDLLILHETNRC